MRKQDQETPIAHHVLRWTLLLTVCTFGLAGVPDLEWNPVTGYVESVDIATAEGERVRHVIDRGRTLPSIVTLVSAGAGVDPRIAIDDDGNSWVVWWEDKATDEIHYAVRDEQTESWTSETLISEPNSSSREPEIVHDGTSTWVVYEVEDSGMTSIGAQEITDGPEPVPQTIATTSFTGDVDLLVHVEDGHVWVTWIDDASYVGWSEYDAASDLWASPSFEPYGGGTIVGARETVRTNVVGP